MKRGLLLLGILAILPFVSRDSAAQTKTGTPENGSLELQARIRTLIAMFGPDPTRGTDVFNPSLPTNLAKEELIAIGKPATLPLCEVLKDKDVWRRLMAVEALMAIRDRRSVGPLILALQSDSSDVVQGEAAEALGEMREPTAVEALMAALKVRNKDVKSFFTAYLAAQSARALGKIGDKRAIPALLPLLGSRERALPAFIAIPLGTVIAESLGKLGPEAAKPLMPLLEHPKAEVRADAVKALGVMKARQAVPLLLTLLTPSLEEVQTDDDFERWEVNKEVIVALGEIGNKRATRLLLKRIKVERLKKEVFDYQNHSVIEALGKIGDPQATETLLQLISSKDSYVRLRALEALWRIKSPKVVEPLLQEAQPDEDHFVYYAMDWLGRMRERRALPILQKALVHEDFAIRDTAATAIGRIDSDLLLSLLNDPNPLVRRAAVYGLGEVGCRKAVPQLIPMLEAEELRCEALSALGKLGTPELLPRLALLMQNKEHLTRSYARRAVIAIKRRYKM
jgi:HEAT repeat protein